MGSNTNLIIQAINGLTAIEQVVSFIYEMWVHAVSEQWVKEFADKDLPVFGLVEAAGALASLMSSEMEQTEEILLEAIDRAQKKVEA